MVSIDRSKHGLLREISTRGSRPPSILSHLLSGSKFHNICDNPLPLEVGPALGSSFFDLRKRNALIRTLLSVIFFYNKVDAPRGRITARAQITI